MVSSVSFNARVHSILILRGGSVGVMVCWMEDAGRSWTVASV